MNKETTNINEIRETSGTNARVRYYSEVDKMRNRDAPKLKGTSQQPYMQNHEYQKDSWIHPPWDIPDIAVALDIETYVRQAIDKKHGLVFKEGYYIGGQSKKALEYLKRRHIEMEWVTGIPMREILGLVVSDLLLWHNAFVLLARDPKKSSGNFWYDSTGKLMKPVYGIYHIPARTMSPKINDRGKIYRWKQRPPGYMYTSSQKTWPEWPASDIVHFKYHYRGIGGVPDILPAISDIQTLRRIEEDVVLLIMKYLFPMLHVKVGSDTLPAGMVNVGGRNMRETDWIKDLIEHGDPSEALVTDHRVEFESIGAKDTTIDVTPYLKYFRERLFSGLGMSPVDFGHTDTSNKSTGEVVSRSTLDTVRRYQSDLVWQWNHGIEQVLLMENPTTREIVFQNPMEDIAGLVFLDPDIDMRVKKINNDADLFNKNVKTLTEVRTAHGLQPMTDKEWETDSYFARVERPKTILSASGAIADEPEDVIAAQKELAKTQAKLAGSGTNTKKPASATNKSIQTKARPENQHGKKLSATSPTSDSVYQAKDADYNNYIVKESMPTTLLDIYDHISIAITKETSQKYVSAEDIGLALSYLKQQLLQHVEIIARDYYMIGVTSARLKRSVPSDYSNTIVNWTTNFVSKIVDDLSAKIASSDSIQDSFDSLRYRVNYLTWSITSKGYNYGRVVQAREDRNRVFVKDDKNQDCEICKDKHGKEINTNVFTLSEIPPFHPGCNGSITIRTNTERDK